MRKDERHQGHANALSKAGMAPKILLTLKEIWKKADPSRLSNEANQETLT